MPLYRYERIPSGHKYIGRGISMVWSGNSLMIFCNVEMSGSAATQEITDGIRDSINRVWNASFDGGYQVRCSINATLRAEGAQPTPGTTDIIITDEAGPSFVHYVADQYSVMNYHTSARIEWTPAHEFGHMLGLRDHYDEAFYSLFIHSFGFDRVTSIQPGWQGNIMAEDRAPLQKRNIQELITLHCMRMVTITEDLIVGINQGMERFSQEIIRLSTY